jgi:hypothetical protein
VSYKRLLHLAEIGAKRELEKALIDFQLMHIESETVPVDVGAYDNAIITIDKAADEYRELTKLIKALESF